MNTTEGGPRGDLDTVDEIAELVRRFYREVAQDDLLGPVFNDVAQVDWAEHLPKLTAFWSRALLSEPGYSGNPYRMHLLVHERSPFTAAHFERWLLLFDEALAGWEGPKVEQARAFANRVAHVHSKALLGTPVTPVTPTRSDSAGRPAVVPSQPAITPPRPAPEPVATPVALVSPGRDEPRPESPAPPDGELRLDVRVDRDVCIGSGQCVHWAPTVFEQDEEAKAVVVAPSDGREDVVLKAIVSCPVEAITLQIGGATVRSRDLANWMSGVEIDDPLVDLLGRLGDEHQELRAALAGLATADDRAGSLAAVSAQAVDHLEGERAAYAALRPLVSPGLVDALLDGHARIDRNLAELRTALDGDGDGDVHDPAVLAAAIEEQIQIEESVLFPVALASLARQAGA